LAPEKISSRGAAEERDPPLDQLIKRADAQANRDDEKRQPVWSGKNTDAQNDFTRDNRGNETLQKVAEPVVVVALPGEDWPEPVEQWNARIGVMAADAQHADMERNQGVAEGGKSKAPVGCEKNGETDEARTGFEPPGKTIVRSPPGP
jgi:hypothetical protein